MRRNVAPRCADARTKRTSRSLPITSFCKGQRQNQFVINDRKALKSLVLAITYRKLCQVVEFHSVASRDYHREGPMFSESSPRLDGASSSEVLLDVIPFRAYRKKSRRNLTRFQNWSTHP